MRVLVVVNDRAGAGDSGLYQFVRHLGLRGCEVVLRYLSEDMPAEAFVTDVTDFDRTVVAGGDGTASAICYATRDTGVPVLPYPAGTANLLAANLGLPTDPPALCDIVMSGSAVTFDLGELEYDNGSELVKSGFAIIAGAGYDAKIMQDAEPLKPAFGAAAYLVSAVTNIAPQLAQFRLVLDGREVTSEGIAVLIVNFARIQFDLPVTPGTDPRDGTFEVAIVRTRTPVGLLPVITAALLDRSGDHPHRSSSFELYSASEISVSAEPALQMQADGEALGSPTPFTARALPLAATLLVANDSPLLGGLS